MTQRRLANFELHELLGEGAMGQVYRAVDVHLDRPVAVKLLSSRLDFDPAFSDRFKREARLAAKLNHPNIATIYAFGEEKGEAYIAMEFVEGVTLEERLRQGALSFAEIRKFGIQIASALDVAHAMEIIHRDIKPSNLMITRNGDIKVMDFGVARRGGETQLTMDGALVGTANIMAPEIVKGAGATTASDLFSLGCVLFEAITGRPAFEGENAMAILYKVMHEDPPDLLGTRDDVPPDVADLVLGLLNKDPEARFGPARAVVDRLTAAGGEAADRPTQTGTLVLPGADAGTLVSGSAPGAPVPERPPIPTWAPRPEIKKLRAMNPWAWTGAMLGLVIVAGVLVLVLQRKDTAREQAVELNNQGQTLWEKTENPTNAEIASIESLFRKSANRDKGYAMPLANLGAFLAKTYRSVPDSLATAETILRKAIDRDPTCAPAHANLADLLDKTKRPEDAREQYALALRLADPKAARDSTLILTCRNNLGSMLTEAGYPDSALKVLRPGVKAFPARAALWRNLALAFHGVGVRDSAIIAIDRAVLLGPNDPKTQDARRLIKGVNN